MIALLKIIHLLALMLGTAASFGNLFVMMAKGPHDLPVPGFIAQLRFLFRISGLTAIIVIWISGLLLMFTGYGLWIDGFAFTAKIVFAGLLLLLVSFINIMAMRPGGPPAWMSSLHFVGAIFLVLAVVFAVIAFS